MQNREKREDKISVHVLYIFKFHFFLCSPSPLPISIIIAVWGHFCKLFTAGQVKSVEISSKNLETFFS